jgi:cell division protein FtsB
MNNSITIDIGLLLSIIGIIASVIGYLTKNLIDNIMQKRQMKKDEAEAVKIEHTSPITCAIHEQKINNLDTAVDEIKDLIKEMKSDLTKMIEKLENKIEKLK